MDTKMCVLQGLNRSLRKIVKLWWVRLRVFLGGKGKNILDFAIVHSYISIYVEK